MKILIATKNLEKIEGAKLAFEEYFDNVKIEGVSVKSEVSDEPINSAILQGAKNRIKNLKIYAKSNNIEADYFIATEGGITDALGVWFNVNIAAIEDLNGNFSAGISQGPQVPDRYIDEIKQSEMGIVKDRIFSDSKYKGKGLDDIITHDVLTRKDLVKNAFIMALSGQINGEVWR